MNEQEVFTRIQNEEPFTFDELTEVIENRLLPLWWKSRWEVRLSVHELTFSHKDQRGQVFYTPSLQTYSSLWFLPYNQQLCSFEEAEQQAWELIQFKFERIIKSVFIELYHKSIGKAFSEIQIYIT